MLRLLFDTSLERVRWLVLSDLIRKKERHKGQDYAKFTFPGNLFQHSEEDSGCTAAQGCQILCDKEVQ